jgi:hypothetical protein
VARAATDAWDASATARNVAGPSVHAAGAATDAWDASAAAGAAAGAAVDPSGAATDAWDASAAARTVARVVGRGKMGRRCGDHSGASCHGIGRSRWCGGDRCSDSSGYKKPSDEGGPGSHIYRITLLANLFIIAIMNPGIRLAGTRACPSPCTADRNSAHSNHCGLTARAR